MASAQDVQKTLMSMDPATLRKFLNEAAKNDPSLARVIAQDQEIEPQESEIDFSFYSDIVSDRFEEYAELQGQEKSDYGKQLWDNVCGDIRAISRRVKKSHGYATRKDAFVNLCRIAGLIVASENRGIWSLLNEDLSVSGQVLEDALFKVVDCMSDSERQRLVRDEHGHGGDSISRIKELIALNIELSGQFKKDSLQSTLDKLVSQNTGS